MNLWFVCLIRHFLEAVGVIRISGLEILETLVRILDSESQNICDILHLAVENCTLFSPQFSHRTTAPPYHRTHSFWKGKPHDSVADLPKMKTKCVQV